MNVTHSSRHRAFTRHRPGLGLCLSIGLLCWAPLSQAKETQHLEALGVVNGNITARSAQVDITVFLSGQPLFSATDLAGTTPPDTLWVELATLVSQDGETLRVQQAFPLAQGGTGFLQIPLQVRINGKTVSVQATETPLGVQMTLSTPSQEIKTVAVFPVGAAQMMVPGTYRGDLQTQVRITAERMSEALASAK